MSQRRTVDGRAAAQGSDPATDRIDADLARLGVGEEVRNALALRLARMAPHLSPESYEAALAGVALAHEIHHEGEQVLRRSVRDLREIERLLGAFTEEMGKLDEALQILATYVKRMRSRARTTERPRWLH
jgi:hypothetical protein